jgi:ferredoxin
LKSDLVTYIEHVPIVEPIDGPRVLPRNVPGEYSVTDKCDGCAYCALVAMANFDFDKRTNTYFVCRQPVGRAELELVIEAMEDCPVGAIDADGHPDRR